MLNTAFSPPWRTSRPDLGMRTTSLVLCIVLALARGCDTDAELEAARLLNPSIHDGRNGREDLTLSETRTGPLVMVPQDKGDLSAACLDGSEYGFYYVASPTNSSKWTINIEGGGWCYDEAKCLSRSKMSLGTSTVWSNVS